jgi:hypothetical protein
MKLYKIILIFLFSTPIFSQDLVINEIYKNKIKIQKYQSSDSSIHGGYQTNSLYIDSENFFFCKEENNNTNIYLFYKKKEIKITNFENIDIYKNVNQFGLTLVLNTKYKKLFFTNGNTIYFIDFSDIDNLNTECIYKIPPKYKLWAPLHITNNGNFLSFTLSIDKSSYLARLDIVKKKLVVKKSPFIGTDNPIANHVQISPWNSNIIMFAHEGSWVEDRVWYWDVKKDTLFNLWKSKKYVEAGHEFFSELNGKQEIFLVQYGSPTRNIPSGILQYDSITSNFKSLFLNREFYFAHASQKNGYIVLDTYRKNIDKQNWILIYDISNHILYKGCTVNTFKHPAHPHPYFNTSGTKVSFNNYNNLTGKIEIEEIKLTDIISKKDIISIIK